MGIESVGLKIAELRKNKGMTQELLANALHVTDKAVSKWETGGGYPDISLLPKIAEVLAVSIDYLLTGKEQDFKPISKLELCAKKDDMIVYQELAQEGKLINVHDEDNKSLIDYVLQYESVHVFRKLTGEKAFENWVRTVRNGTIADGLIRMAIISNDLHFLARNRINLFGFKINSTDYSPKTNIELTKTLICDDRVLTETRQFIFGESEKKPNYVLFAHFVDAAIEYDKDGYANELLDFGIRNNQVAMKEYEQEKRLNPTFYRGITNSKGIVEGPHGHPVLYFLEIEKNTVIKALDKNKYELARKMNSLNSLFCSGKAYVAEKDEFESRKIKNDASISTADKRKLLVIHDGLLNVDELIALNDFKTFQEMITLPATDAEIILNLIEKEDYRELLKKALDNATKYPWLPEAVLTMNATQILKANPRSLHHIPSKEELDTQKRQITLKQIINHKDIEFFSLACKKDPKNIDWALEHVEPSRFEVIKLLLDNGAQLHKRGSQDDGWGYNQNYDEIDKIGTEILKKKINEIVGGNSK